MALVGVAKIIISPHGLVLRMTGDLLFRTHLLASCKRVMSHLCSIIHPQFQILDRSH